MFREHHRSLEELCKKDRVSSKISENSRGILLVFPFLANKNSSHQGSCHFIGGAVYLAQAFYFLTVKIESLL